MRTTHFYSFQFSLESMKQILLSLQRDQHGFFSGTFILKFLDLCMCMFECVYICVYVKKYVCSHSNVETINNMVSLFLRKWTSEKLKLPKGKWFIMRWIFSQAVVHTYHQGCWSHLKGCSMIPLPSISLLYSQRDTRHVHGFGEEASGMHALLFMASNKFQMIHNSSQLDSEPSFHNLLYLLLKYLEVGITYGLFGTR